MILLILWLTKAGLRAVKGKAKSSEEARPVYKRDQSPVASQYSALDWGAE